MSPIVKYFEDKFLKPAADKLLAEAETDKAQWATEIEGTVAAGGVTAEGAVQAFIQAKLKSSNPIIEAAESFGETFVLPELESELQAAVASGSTTVPALLDKGLAIFQKIDSEL